MIHRDTFIDAMDRITATHLFQEQVSRLYTQFGYEPPIYDAEIQDTLISVLEEQFNGDEDKWLSYFIYDTDYLKKCDLLDIVVNGQHIDISDWGDVYDILIKVNEVYE